MDLIKENKKVALVLAIALPLFIALLVLSRPAVKKVAMVRINDKSIKAELAMTNAERYQGLSERKNLCADCGMLFLFPTSLDLDFVMRNMDFPLDIIFINQGRIIKIAENLAPEGGDPKKVYASDGPADQVLEVNGGFASRNGIKIGDHIQESN